MATRKRKSQTIKNRIYLDNASATRLDPAVSKYMDAVGAIFGNPSALHKEGQRARAVVEASRAQVAETMNVQPREIIWTSGTTEANTLAIRGTIMAVYASLKNTGKIPHIVTTKIEHASVLETCRALEAQGFAEVTYVDVGPNGIVDPKVIKAALKDATVLVSVMYANNEIGTIQPVREIAKEIRHYKKNIQITKNDLLHRNAGRTNHYPLFHTDAAQAGNYLEIHADRLGVDLLSMGGGKLYGPKGIGFLYVRRNTQITPIHQGGGQEFGLRSGTESVSEIVGCAYAFVRAQENREKESQRQAKLRDGLFDDLVKNFPDMRINGDQTQRIPNNINVSFPGIESEELVLRLDAKGIAVSGKSACESDSPEESHVLRALYGDSDSMMGSLRISIGNTTTKKEIEIFLKTLKDVHTMLTYTK